jgi:peptidoglycan hydrolase CwlO-like protein
MNEIDEMNQAIEEMQDTVEEMQKEINRFKEALSEISNHLVDNPAKFAWRVLGGNHESN